MVDYWCEDTPKSHRKKYLEAKCYDCGYRIPIKLIEAAEFNCDCPQCGKTTIRSFVPIPIEQEIAKQNAESLKTYVKIPAILGDDVRYAIWQKSNELMKRSDFDYDYFAELYKVIVKFGE